MTQPRVSDLASDLTAAVPYLRRYARALTGSQDSGDRYALAALEALVSDPATASEVSSPKVALFRGFHSIWSSTGQPVAEEDHAGGLLETRAQWRLQELQANTREALLLRTIEGLTDSEIGEVMAVSEEEAGALVETAFSDMADLVAGKVLIIEDEAIIAMDLESTVASMGHRVTGVARTHEGAVKLGLKEPPDLILADIQLADKSSGIDAVNDLLADLGDVPVVFITAFPERLLTGERPEPAFLITKPYSEDQVRTAVSQAMFFASTEPLKEAG